MTLIHEAYCRYKALGHTDAAKRFSDTYNLHKIGAGSAANGKWIAIALHDGSSDDTLYDDKLAAVTHQRHNEQFYVFIRIVPPSMRVCDAEVMLDTHRRMYDAGIRMTDPDHKHGGMDVIKRLTQSDQLAWARGAVTGLIMPWERN
jgi:hypothetical protein